MNIAFSYRKLKAPYDLYIYFGILKFKWNLHVLALQQMKQIPFGIKFDAVFVVAVAG